MVYVERPTSDDCAEGSSHALTCSLERDSGRLSCGHRMRECRSLPCSPVLESDGLDPTPESNIQHYIPVELTRWRGANASAVAKSMGHVDIKSMEPYQHHELEPLREIINQRNQRKKW